MERDAVRVMKPNRPVYRLDAYALQAIRLESKWRPYSTIEQIAKSLLTELKQLQPRGPYQITGGCEGSLVAFEMALQLQRQGEQVSQLIVWITPAPGEPLNLVSNRSTLRRLWYQFQSLRAKGSIKQLGWHGQMNLLRHEVVEFSLFSAMLKYRPRDKFEGHIEVFRVHFGNDDLISDYELGWGNMATQGASAIQMPGDHETWLSEHADVFAKEIDARLESQKAATVAGEPSLPKAA